MRDRKKKQKRVGLSVGSRAIGPHQDQVQDLEGLAHDGDPGQDAEKNLRNLGKVHGHDEADKLLNAGINGAALVDCLCVQVTLL